MTRWLTLLALFALSLIASAETFRLRNGTVLNGTIKQGGGGSVRIETADGVGSYRIIDFDDATQARLSRYDTPAAASTPAPAPQTPPRPAIAPEPPPKVQRTTNVEAEPEEEETTTEVRRFKSPDDVVKQIQNLKGPSKMVYLGGFALCMIGGLWMIIRGFQESLLWGIGLIICGGILWLLFLIMHWSKAKDPFFLNLIGIAMMLFAIVVMG